MNPSVLPRTAIAAALFVASGTLALADTATTDPVGFFTNTLLASGGTSRVSRTMSVPLYRPAVYTAAATVVTATTVSLNGGNFGTGGGAQIDVVTNAHLVRVKAAATTAHIGRFFLVTAQSGADLTVGESALTSYISVGDTVEVLPANTLGNLFGTVTGTTSTVPAGWLTASTAQDADNVHIFNGTAWLVYYHNGTNWRRSGSPSNQNPTIIYPDEGVFISRIGTTPVDLVNTGAVPTTTERTDLSAASSTVVANRFPVDVQLSAVGFELTAGWVAASTAADADKVYIYNPSNNSWEIFYHNGTNWRRSGSPSNQNPKVITSGTAVFVTRSGASVSTLAQSLPYTP